jgi:hypothetical protein
MLKLYCVQLKNSTVGCHRPALIQREQVVPLATLPSYLHFQHHQRSYAQQSFMDRDITMLAHYRIQRGADACHVWS